MSTEINAIVDSLKNVGKLHTLKGLFGEDSKTGWELPDGYIFKDENGKVINATKIVLEKEKEEDKITLEELKKCMNDYAYWLRKYVRFTDKDGNVLKIILKKEKNEDTKGTKVRHKTKGMVETIVGLCKIKYMGAWVDGVIYEGIDTNTGEPMTFVRVKEDFENNFEIWQH